MCHPCVFHLSALHPAKVQCMYLHIKCMYAECHLHLSALHLAKMPFLRVCAGLMDVYAPTH